MKTNKFAKARKVMRNTFKKDPDLERGYVDNIAMRLYDLQSGHSKKCINFNDKETRDLIARNLLDLIFGK